MLYASDAPWFDTQQYVMKHKNYISHPPLTGPSLYQALNTYRQAYTNKLGWKTCLTEDACGMLNIRALLAVGTTAHSHSNLRSNPHGSAPS